jgi:hypothetical protein
MSHQREHSVETIRRNSEVMGNLRKLMVVNRGVSFEPCWSYDWKEKNGVGQYEVLFGWYV